jgi:hypothetical protein
MDKQKLIDYFESYVKKYPPYKNDKLFTGICTYLVDYYYDDVYNKVPQDLKSIFENQELITSVYDKFLIAIGVPQEVINKLNYNEKIVFLRSLSDFRRYKGTVEFIRKIGRSFTDSFNVYELYIDYDSVEGWCFKPVIIYQDENLDVVNETISYQTIYDSVPSFLIDEEQMENLRQANQVTLPVKSNILLLDQKIVDNISVLNNLIISTFLKEYGESYVNIYFSNRQFTLSFKVINYLWYYLTTRYYGTNWLASEIFYTLQFDDFHNPYTIFDLDDLLSEYNALETNREIDRFYREKFIEPFGQYVKKDAAEVDDMKVVLENLDSAFSSYVEDRIDGSGDPNKEISIIITEIYNSLLLYRDTYSTSTAGVGDPFLKYYDYFLSSLPQLTINPEDTTSYLLIYNFKPYHTELFSVISNVLTYEDKFNNTILSDEHYFIFEMVRYDLLSLIDETVIDLELFKQSDIKLSNFVEFVQTITASTEWTILDYLSFEYTEEMGDTLDLSSFVKTVSDMLNKQDNLVMSSVGRVKQDFTKSDLSVIDEVPQIVVTPEFGSPLDIDEMYTIT